MTCKICRAPVERFRDEVMKCDFFHCKACSFIFKNEKNIVSEAYERRHYEQHDNSFESPGYVAMFEEFIEKCVTPYRSGMHTVLDFGSGPGPVLSELLERNGFEVDIYDKFFAPEPVYENKTYDLITCTEVLEHIKAPLDIMIFFREHLAENGLLCLMTHFHSDEKNEFLRWWYRMDPTHICFFRPETFKAIAERLGFELLYFDEKKLSVLKKLA
jgi:2-polyprenyl-3-methyl-5-hydroxy-6-metoxy-1,4-benzoquinol methylase